jgi:SAM-dependent methyltransferase
MYDNIDYANCYDILYAKKDYEADVESIIKVLQLNPGSKIIDIGCGTGNYTKYLSIKGFDVTGVEPSVCMLNIAKSKRIKASFFNGYVHEYPIKHPGFDGAFAMFNIINHIQDISSLYQFFESVYVRLESKAKFVFDCYNGYECIIDPPRDSIVEHNTSLGIYRQVTKNDNYLSHHKSTLKITVEMPKDKIVSVKCDVVFWPLNVIVGLLDDLSFKNTKVTEKSKRTYIISTER